MACSDGDISNWAKGIKLPTCIGAAFCAQYGRLPNSIDELNSWGDASGYHHGATWTCSPSGNPGSGQPGDKVTVGGSVGGSASAGVSLGGLGKWAETNPILAAGILGVLGYALFARH